MKSVLGLNEDEKTVRSAILMVLVRLRTILEQEEKPSDTQKYIVDIENAFYDLKYMNHKDFSMRDQLRAATRLSAYTVRFVIDEIISKKYEDKSK